MNSHLDSNWLEFLTPSIQKVMKKCLQLKSLLNLKEVGIIVIDSSIMSTLPERLKYQLSASVTPTVQGIGTEEDTTLRDTIRKAIGVDLWK